jgi:alpha-galactosidase
MPRKKITFIGAGSIGFTRKLVADLLTVPELRDVELAFTDINARNLETVARICRADLAANGLATPLHATTDRREALTGAHYVFCVVRIGGLEAFATDIDIPLKYGVDQCVGDTLCAGGLMYAQRGIAALLDFCRDIREVAAPDCILFNYANPMAMLTWAANVYGGVRTIGLCHGVQHGHYQIAKVFGLPRDEVDIICAGINHQTWYVSVKHQGRDLTGKLLAAFEKHAEYAVTEKVRIDMLRRFGYYSTESNGHLSEYVPWYRKRPAEIKKWIDLKSSWINGETGGYLRVCTEGRNWFEEEFGPGKEITPLTYTAEKRSEEHGSRIVEALETGRVYRGHFNVPNRGVITNLPDDCIIEAPGYVDANGINMPSWATCRPAAPPCARTPSACSASACSPPCRVTTPCCARPSCWIRWWARCAIRRRSGKWWTKCSSPARLGCRNTGAPSPPPSAASRPVRELKPRPPAGPPASKSAPRLRSAASAPIPAPDTEPNSCSWRLRAAARC